MTNLIRLFSLLVMMSFTVGVAMASTPASQSANDGRIVVAMGDEEEYTEPSADSDYESEAPAEPAEEQVEE